MHILAWKGPHKRCWLSSKGHNFTVFSCGKRSLGIPIALLLIPHLS